MVNAGKPASPGQAAFILARTKSANPLGSENRHGLPLWEVVFVALWLSSFVVWGVAFVLMVGCVEPFALASCVYTSKTATEAGAGSGS